MPRIVFHGMSGSEKELASKIIELFRVAPDAKKMVFENTQTKVSDIDGNPAPFIEVLAKKVERAQELAELIGKTFNIDVEWSPIGGFRAKDT